MSGAAAHCELCEQHERAKKEWGEGPWQSEPHRAEWEHAGLPCIAHRGGSGAWCGYVGISPGHPFHGKGYSEVEESVSVHGGLTYAEACQGHICHVPKPGEPDNLWWFGFDAAHAGDMTPRSLVFSRKYSLPADAEHYWTLAEIQAETNRLAEQLAAVKS